MHKHRIPTPPDGQETPAVIVQVEALDTAAAALADFLPTATVREFGTVEVNEAINAGLILGLIPGDAGDELTRHAQEAIAEHWSLGPEARLLHVPHWKHGKPLRLPAAAKADAIGYLMGLPIMPVPRVPKPRAEPNGKTHGSEKLPAEPTGSDEEEDGKLIEFDDFPAPPDAAAYHGIAGECVRRIEEHTEADPVAILVNLELAFGNAVGRGAFVEIEGTPHYPNEFAVTAGDSSFARKGTASRRGLAPMKDADPGWYSGCVKWGLSSGEGLIATVRDQIVKRSPIREKGRIIDYQDEVVDEGISDKRAFVAESEFGGVLRVLEREGNKLSAVLRCAWDGDNLATLTKIAMRATDPHITLVGHVTTEELRAHLGTVEVFGGLAGRFLWIACRRSKMLPRGGGPVNITTTVAALMAALEAAKKVGRVDRSPAAWELWEEHYPRLTARTPGLLGMVTNRGAAHVLRLALIYCLLDQKKIIEPDHLTAAMALWDYAFRSAKYIFGAALADPLAEKILAALVEAGDAGLTRTQIRSDVLQRHTPAPRIASALAYLLKHGMARQEAETNTGGRPAVRFFACAKSAVSAQRPPSEAEQALYGASGANGARGIVASGDTTCSAYSAFGAGAAAVEREAGEL